MGELALHDARYIINTLTFILCNYRYDATNAKMKTTNLSHNHGEYSSSLHVDGPFKNIFFI